MFERMSSPSGGLVRVGHEVGAHEHHSGRRPRESPGIGGRADSDKPRDPRPSGQVRRQTALRLCRLLRADHRDRSRAEPLSGQPQVDLRGRLKVAPPGLAIGLAYQHPDRRPGPRVLDHDLVRPPGAAAVIAHQQERPAEPPAGDAAQQRAQHRVGDPVGHHEATAGGHGRTLDGRAVLVERGEHDRRPGGDVRRRADVLQQPLEGVG
jgi:hypothetical protein